MKKNIVYLLFATLLPLSAEEAPAKKAELPKAETPPAPAPALTDAEKAEIAADERKHKAKWEMEDAPAGKLYGGPGRGIIFVTADKSFSANLRARFQLRYSEHWVNDYNSREVQPRTARLFWAGHIFSTDLRYTIQVAIGARDLENATQNPDPNSPLFDAYLEWKRWRDLNITVGQFFVPFSRLRYIREFALHFIDRQVAIRPLTLDRDTGISFSSEDLFGLNQWVGYDLGFFGGHGRNRIESNFNGTATSTTTTTTTGTQGAPSGLIVGRLFLTPFGAFDQHIEGDIDRLDKPRLLLSVGYAYNYNSDRLYSTNNSLTTRATSTVIQNAPAYTDYRNLAFDVILKWKGISIELEYLMKKAKDDLLGYSGTTLSTPVYSQSGHGWIAQLGVHPFPKDWAQIEFVGRFAQLFSDSPNAALTQLSDQQRNEAVGGVNYYLNGHLFKIQADYFQVWGNAYTEHGIRTQLDVMF